MAYRTFPKRGKSGRVRIPIGQVREQFLAIVPGIKPPANALNLGIVVGAESARVNILHPFLSGFAVRFVLPE